MREVAITARAKADIRRLSRHGVIRYGTGRAVQYADGLRRQFDLLATYPFIGRPVLERPTYLRFGYGSHIVIYSVEQDRIVIRRVLHASTDVSGQL